MALSRLQHLQDEMKKCIRCSLCKMVPLPVVQISEYSDGCPAGREFHFHGYTGSGKSIVALSLVDGRIEVDQALADITYACTACGLCDVSCKFNMEAERHQVNMALREHVVDEGFDLPVHRKVIENLHEYGHPEGKVRDSAGSWAKDMGLKTLPAEKADVLLFAGCLQSIDPDLAATTRKMALLLKHAGVDFGILGDAEKSCGLTAYWTGYRDPFTKIAVENTSLLDSLNVETIVTVSGSCLGAFRSKYREYARAPDAETLHASEFLARLIGDNKLRLAKSLKRKVTYHDPCYLGRMSEPPVEWEGEHKIGLNCMSYTDPPKTLNNGTGGVFDPPRQILSSIRGLDFVEMYRICEYAFCCGGGGGVPKAYPNLAKSAALHRLEEARDVGADYLVTACHECRLNLSRSQKSMERDSLPVVDIIDLVYEAADIGT